MFCTPCKINWWVMTFGVVVFSYMDNSVYLLDKAWPETHSETGSKTVPICRHVPEIHVHKLSDVLWLDCAVSRTLFLSTVTCMNQQHFLVYRVLLLKLKCFNMHETTACYERLRWSKGSVLAFGAQVSGIKPSRSRWIFSGRKNPQHVFLRKRSKAVCPMS